MASECMECVEGRPVALGLCADCLPGEPLGEVIRQIARLARELEEARERERALREALMTISMRCYKAVMQTPLLEHQSMHALAGVCKQDADAALAGQSALAVDSEAANGWRGSRE